MSETTVQVGSTSTTVTVVDGAVSAVTVGPVAGPRGPGVPDGGSTGQVLAKVSGTDQDTEWSTLTAAAVGADPAGTAAAEVTAHVEDTTAHPASSIAWDDTDTELGVTDTQAAIEAVVDSVNTISGTTIPAAIADVRDLSAHAPFDGGAGYRPHDMETWWGLLNDAQATQVDIVVIGDSLSMLNSTAYPTMPWPWLMRERINQRSCLDESAGVDGVFCAGSGNDVPRVTSTTGSDTTTGLGGYATALDAGEKVTHTFTGDGFSILYGKGPGTRGLIIRDGVGGTVLATLDTSGTAKSSNLWTSGALSSATRTIEIEATGSGNVVEWIQPYNGDRTKGVRCWVGAHSGYQTSQFTADPSLVLDLIDNLDTAGTLGLVIMATGTNDNPVDTTEFDALRAAIRARTACDILVWVPYYSTAMTLAEQDDIRAWAEMNNHSAIDPSKVLGEVEVLDGVHQSENARVLCADVATYAVGGDPIGAPSSEWRRTFQALAHEQSWAGSNNRAEVEEYGGLGRQTISLYDALADTQPSLTMFPAFLAGLLGAPGAALVAGPGGSTIPDTLISRSAAGTVGIYPQTAPALATDIANKAYVDVRSPAVARESGAWYAQHGLCTASTSLGMTASGVLMAMPVFLQAGSYDRLGVATSVAAVSTWRLGVYPSSSTTGLPDGRARLLDGGTVNMNATAGILTATVSLTIPSTGIYWLVALVDAYTATPTVYGWTSTSGTAQSPAQGTPISFTSGATAARHKAGRTATGVATGSIPATCPTLAWSELCPRIAVRAS